MGLSTDLASIFAMSLTASQQNVGRGGRGGGGVCWQSPLLLLG